MSGPNRARAHTLLISGLLAVAVALVAALLVVGLDSNGVDRERVAGPDAAVRERADARPSKRGARLFAADSVWNQRLADDAPLDPDGVALVGKLRATVAQNIAARWGPWIQTRDTSTPLYIVSARQATIPVTLHTGSWGKTLQTAFQKVPIPAHAVPAAGPDGHMTVWQPSRDRLWEFFKARRIGDRWHADFGGAIKDVSRSPGYYTRKSWPGLSHSYWGATATSLPVAAGTMLIDELRSGVIPHALAMNIPFARPKVFSWPAQRTDGTSTDAEAIPEGARFRLDPKLDIGKLDLPPMTRMMAEAAQRYGVIVRDQTAHAIAFFGEDPTPLGKDPYGGRDGFFGGSDPSAIMQAFPWDRLQLLKMRLDTVS